MTTTDTAVPTPRFVPRRDRRWSANVQWVRHGIQAAFAIWLAVTLGQHLLTPSSGSVEAVCPFGGFETAWTWLTTGRTVSHTHSANLVLAGVVTVLAVLARGFFCGWICVLGSMQESVRAIGRRLERVVPGMRAVRRWLEPGPRLDRALRLGRYAVLVWAIGGAAVTGTMVFRAVDPWSAFLGIVDFEFSTGIVVLIVMLVLALFIDRPFCRYACPLGAVQGIVAKASPVAIQRSADACLGCEICNNACPMGIPVNQRTRVTDASCIGCLQCVSACPSQDALALTVSFPSRTGRIDSHV